MKIQIKNRFSYSVVFETDAETLGAAVVAAIAARANLSWADLSRANLSGADLSRADLSGANLSWADLSRANLSWADLSRADLSGAKIQNAQLSEILQTRTILPEGDLIGWKRLNDGTICKLKIPAEAKRIGGLIGRKCRAEYAIVLDGSGTSERGGIYKKGQRVMPDKYDPNPMIECSHGIHFFITRAEAEAY